jgi:hypothetical protein
MQHCFFILNKCKLLVVNGNTATPVLLHGCETWSLTFRGEHRLRVFGEWGLRKTFGSKREGVTGDWRKLHREELQDLCCSPNIMVIKWRMKWAGHVAHMGKQ